MIRTPPSKRRAFTGLVVAILCLGPTGLTAGQFKWLVGGDKNTKYKLFKDPAGRFELQYPEKDWKPLPAVGSSLAVFARNDGPTLFVDHVKLVGELTPPEVAGMPAVELSTLKDQQPKAKDFKSEMLDSKAGNGVLIRYSRDNNGPQTVVQYSIAVGLELYRINGVIPDKQLAKYEPVVMYMIQSFTAPPPGAAKK
ncbi:MAG: hypothetical protein ACRD2I_13785 [Vicinamibacterales bacterium]